MKIPTKFVIHYNLLNDVEIICGTDKRYYGEQMNVSMEYVHWKHGC